MSRSNARRSLALNAKIDRYHREVMAAIEAANLTASLALDVALSNEAAVNDIHALITGAHHDGKDFVIGAK